MGGAGATHDPPLLFNLNDDPGEKQNVAAAHPEIVAEFLAEAASHKAAMVAGKPLFDELSTSSVKPR
jgi:arylsulfatase A